MVPLQEKAPEAPSLEAPSNLPPLGEALAAAEFPFKSEGDGGWLSLFCPLWHAISTNVSAKTIAVANLSLFISHYSLFTFSLFTFPFNSSLSASVDDNR
jgi:hypothetical protein